MDISSLKVRKQQTNFKENYSSHVDKKLIVKNIFLALLFLASTSLFAQSNDSLLIEALKSNTYQIRIENGQLSGSGLHVIEEAIEDAQFLLVGEQHGIREVSIFTDVLFQKARTSGFEYLCIETDPYIASKLTELAPGGEKALKAYVNDFPISIPFYDSKEEFNLIQNTIATSSLNTPVLWGVDQVFMGAPRYLFSKLASLTSDLESNQLFLDYFARANNEFSEAMQTQNFMKLIMNSLTPTDFNILYDGIGDPPHMEAKNILDDLKASQQIYGFWSAGKQYENNYTRAQLMKRQFMKYYNAAVQDDKLPKVVFKFGSTHTYRGLSYYDQYDLGNLVSELAEINNKHSVHFNIMGLTGQTQGILGPPQSFDNTSTLDPIFISVLSDYLNSEDWILIDMKPIRSIVKPSYMKPIRDKIFGYDFWIFIPEAKPVSQLSE